VNSRTQRRLFHACALVLGALLAGLVWRAWLLREPSYQGKTVTEWARSVASPDAVARTQAAAALRALGPEATRVLIDTLGRRDSWVERTYLTNEARLPRSAKRGLVGVIRPYHAATERLNATRALGLLGPQAANAVPALIAALEDPGPGVSTAAAVALGQMGPAAVQPLTAASAGADASVRGLILFALGQIGPEAAPAVPELARQLETADALLTPLVMSALARIGSAAVPALVERLAHAAPRTREVAAQGLGSIGPNAREAVTPLLEALRDAHPAVRSAAAQSLGKIQPTAPMVVQALVTVLEDGEATVRQAALVALTQACGSAPRHTGLLGPALIEALRDEAATNRIQAATLLALVRPPATNAVPALTERLQDGDAKVREAAKAALEKITSGGAGTN
jgi:HEAT repeat protein